MIAGEFEYVRPRDLDEALAALAAPDASAIAGGHSLVPLLKLRIARPSILVDLAGVVPNGVRAEAGRLRIGAMTTYDELLGCPVAVPDALLEAAACVGDLQVRNAGTIGGAIAHADPACDIAAALLALGAIVRTRGVGGARELPIGEFFTGPYQTALAQPELVEELVVDIPRRGDGSAYAAIPDPASGYPLAGVAVLLRGGRESIGIAGATARPVKLGGERGDEELAQIDLAVPEADVAYRRHLLAVALDGARESARTRAGGAA